LHADGNLEEHLIRAESREAAHARADAVAMDRGDQILEVTPVAEGLRHGVCCKCGSHRVVKDLQLPVGSPGELPAVLRAAISWPALFATTATLTACICATCGYAELYADTDIEKLWLEIESRAR
jgi:predicted nucleic-acid-binding Zn-ribbon protein